MGQAKEVPSPSVEVVVPNAKESEVDEVQPIANCCKAKPAHVEGSTSTGASGAGGSGTRTSKTEGNEKAGKSALVRCFTYLS